MVPGFGTHDVHGARTLFSVQGHMTLLGTIHVAHIPWGFYLISFIMGLAWLFMMKDFD